MVMRATLVAEIFKGDMTNIVVYFTAIKCFLHVAGSEVSTSIGSLHVEALRNVLLPEIKPCQALEFQLKRRLKDSQMAGKQRQSSTETKSEM